MRTSGMAQRATVAFLSAELAAKRTTSAFLVEQALSRIYDTGGEGSRAFVKVYAEAARAEAEASDRLRAAGVVRSPVEGIPVSVKDLFDVSGDVTLAGSKALATAPPATADAPAVARLRAAGAVVVGRTHMVEFAFGGVGLNAHFDAPRNPYDRGAGRIPGGSSSGAAVAVADGMCAMSLGSDTRGSVRIPSALCGVVGFKPTQARVPRDGSFPLSYTLDSVGPLARSVECCAVFDAILAGSPPATAAAPAPLPVNSLTLLLPRCSATEGLQPHVESCFRRAVDKLAAAGARVVEQDEPLLTRAQALFANGGFAGAEAFHIHRALLEEHEAEYDPLVASRIGLGSSFTAADYIQLGFDRKALINEVAEAMRPFDAMLLPTVKSVAPTIAEASSSTEVYTRINLEMLHNPGLINIVDGCAATLPCHSSDEAPVGLMVSGIGGSDRHVLAVARSIEACIEQP